MWRHFEHCVGTVFKNPLDALGIVLGRGGVGWRWNAKTSCLDAAGAGASKHVEHVGQMQFIDQRPIDIVPWNIALLGHCIIISKVFNLIQALCGYYPSDSSAIESQYVVSWCSLGHENAAEVDHANTRFHVF